MEILNQKQYIGHARHEGPFQENSLELYHYLVEQLSYKIIEADVVFTVDQIPVLNHGVLKRFYMDGHDESVDISKVTLNDLLVFSRKDSNHRVTTVEEYIEYGKSKNIMVMLDLTFQNYTQFHYKVLYDIVCKYEMQNQVIWGDADILKLARLNRHLIVQVGGSWGRKLLIKSFLTSFLCKTTIMSFSYYGGNVESFQHIVKWGHRLGFVMKVATVNDLDLANRFWKIGTDLINTDKLLNS